MKDEIKLRKTAERKVESAIRKGAYKKRIEPVKKAIPKEPVKDTVPVQLDHKTTIYVLKEKCVMVNGKWIKKENK